VVRSSLFHFRHDLLAPFLTLSCSYIFLHACHIILRICPSESTFDAVAAQRSWIKLSKLHLYLDASLFWTSVDFTAWKPRPATLGSIYNQKSHGIPYSLQSIFLITIQLITQIAISNAASAIFLSIFIIFLLFFESRFLWAVDSSANDLRLLLRYLGRIDWV